MDKKILYLDMDGVLVDFVSGIRKYDPEALLPYADHPDEAPGIFSIMDPIPGAKEAVERLSEHFDVYILSTAPWMNPSAWTDKVVWVKEHYGDLLKKHIIISHRKDLLRGVFLVDEHGLLAALEDVVDILLGEHRLAVHDDLVALDGDDFAGVLIDKVLDP